MNEFFISINSFLEALLFFDILFGTVDGVSFPFLVAWLISGGIYLTFLTKFINVRAFTHSFNILRGKYKTIDDEGQISPFAALTTALSATVGLGNIAGVALAVSIGGPGATFWMIVAGFLGMSLKFTEVTLSLQYREFLKDGTIMGGAMEYLSKGLAKKGYVSLGKVLAVVFAFLMIGGAIGGGNIFQVSQAYSAISHEVPYFSENPLVFGFIIATLTGAVIIGGITRISAITERLVPIMVVIYLSASIWILGSFYDKIDDAFVLIFEGAFSTSALYGGMIGALIQGFQRAVFSSEAGLGSSPVAHAPVLTKYPVRQGFVALYEPFIDTVVICTMTALVIIITGVYEPDGVHASLIAAKEGAALTSAAYGTVISWFPTVLSVSIFLFAFSTMISWSYYGERAWVYLFGSKFSIIYKILFLSLSVIATVVNTGIMVDFSFMLMLTMALPNILGLFILSGDVKKQLEDYLVKLKSGELDREAII
ncbi:alanine:cation symporter family protein [Candidatus Sulfurimonas marisnigri]|uniref:Alanine:cation symporter family protein n=1 Tax=Candidatus Sulfurimonas marisnigri TaxID=2740405 RepID=A0A7S7RPX3_9BACT|nr:alanine/glycine:cation symporter family protein [Candidatus Sulfurimonas marisnigri]QOY54837.1 alanine:cation symporter family protein [Candidatus Sulfurimonas marisnigri]